MDEEVLTPTRELIEGVYHSVHVSKDGLIRVGMGPDDQRPEHDGAKFFQPICVAEYRVGGERVYAYVHYCGKCRRRMREVSRYCPECGAGIAHYVFRMGITNWVPETLKEQLPEEWPGEARAEEVERGT